MSALLNPAHRTKKVIKWGLVTHIVAMFSFVTISCAMNRTILSIAYIDNREFSGVGFYPSGPIEYLTFAQPGAVLSIISFLWFPINQWLADGLLVGSASNPVAQVSDVDRPFSCIVVMSFIP